MLGVSQVEIVGRQRHDAVGARDEARGYCPLADRLARPVEPAGPDARVDDESSRRLRKLSGSPGSR